MRQYFLTSDTHFGHEKILQYCNRPFSSIQKHDEALIENWNSVVGPKDLVYHLGDFCLQKDKIYDLLTRLNGSICFIFGNHDYRNESTYLKYVGLLGKDRFKVETSGLLKIKVPREAVLCHYPMLSWHKSNYGIPHFYGHIHNSPLNYYPKNSYNVGVDVNNFTPIGFEELINKCQGKINKGKGEGNDNTIRS